MKEKGYVEKTGWEILMGRLNKEPKKVPPESPSVQVKEEVRKVLLPSLPKNPLRFSIGDILLLEIPEAEEMRLVVDRALFTERKIGDLVFRHVDYVLCDPTNESVSIGLRATSKENGDTELLLLVPDGDNLFDEELKRMLEDMKPGDPQGFPRQEEAYFHFARPPGATSSYVARVTEYDKDGKKKTYEKEYWDFVRDPSHGEPVYIFDMSHEDGYFYAYFGRPLSISSVSAFRYQ